MDPYQSPEELDFDNPYAPPRSSFQPEEKVDRQGVSIPFTVDSIVNTSWTIFKAQLGTFLWVVWAPLGVNIGLGIALTIVNAALLAAMPGDRMTAMAIYWVLYVLSLLIQTWLGIGMTLGLFKAVRGEPVAFDVLFSGGRYILRVVLGFILLFLIFMVILLVPLFLIGAASAMLANNAAAGIVFMVITVAFCVVVMLYMSCAAGPVLLPDPRPRRRRSPVNPALLAAHFRPCRHDHLDLPASDDARCGRFSRALRRARLHHPAELRPLDRHLPGNDRQRKTPRPRPAHHLGRAGVIAREAAASCCGQPVGWVQPTNA